MWKTENVTSATAASYSVATSSPESLPNDDKKPNQPKKRLLPKCDYGKVSVKRVCSV